MKEIAQFTVTTRFVPMLESELNRIEERAYVGNWFQNKWRDKLRDCGGDYQYVAKQMRKQGIPLFIALLLLFGARG